MERKIHGKVIKVPKKDCQIEIKCAIKEINGKVIKCPKTMVRLIQTLVFRKYEYVIDNSRLSDFILSRRAIVQLCFRK